MLPFRSGRSHRGSTLFLLILIAICVLVANVGKAKDTKKPKPKSAEKDVSDSSASVPIPIGHEAKGVTLPITTSKGASPAAFSPVWPGASMKLICRCVI